MAWKRRGTDSREGPKNAAYRRDHSTAHRNTADRVRRRFLYVIMSISAPSITTSVLDRLIDNEPQNRHSEVPKNQSQILNELRQYVRRDLQNLLNSRLRCTTIPSDLRELEVSLVNFGIPDFCGENSKSENSEELLDYIRSAIQNFEPRLKKVQVTAIENEKEKGISRILQFRIRAVLCVDPIQDQVSYNSTLEVSTGDFRVEANKNDR